MISVAPMCRAGRRAFRWLIIKYCLLIRLRVALGSAPSREGCTCFGFFLPMIYESQAHSTELRGLTRVTVQRKPAALPAARGGRHITHGGLRAREVEAVNGPHSWYVAVPGAVPGALGLCARHTVRLVTWALSFPPLRTERGFVLFTRVSPA